ncbi:DUF2971 domain-containing protein [Sulfuriferula sp.]|uniref:DUF2971 domain-containing protein n=1 Tax=Sulfuriferula sp. TaxID=2025307 RepID=UPI00273181AC|nr:DUF2971 domain-containing protein [Sulfuriferula sp.]MDP2027714.1 DUF2971 domain-containing protein [Sulfuriferula sp.]
MADPQTNAELLHELYEKRDPCIQLLYKYRSCAPHNLDILSENGIWLSRHEQLNDPFDCLIRLPNQHSVENLSGLAKLLRGAPPYTLEIDNGEDAMQYIAAANELKPLDCIGLLAGQLHDYELLKHIKVVRADDTGWLATLVELSSDIHHTMLVNTGIFSLSETPVHPLMWAHYAASHSGYCIGYACPVGIENPRNIHKVRYVENVPKISPRKIVHDPREVMNDLILTKPAVWQYEREWRVTLGTLTGLVKDWLAPRRVIFGARIDPGTEVTIRKNLEGKPIEFLRVVPSLRMGRFRLELRPA